MAGGATGGPRRPYAVIAGLVLSFTVFTLTAAALLSSLGLPEDLLRHIAIAVVVVVGLSLVWPRLGDLLGRPFYGLARRNPGDSGGFVLGLSLGLLFTPCAGPVIAAVATVAATQSFSATAFLITLSYALGAGETTAMRPTPATCAGTAVMTSDDGSGALPLGTHTPTESRGTHRRSDTMPGAASTTR